MTKTLTEQIVHIQNDLDVVFDEVVKLEKKFEIATKALKELELKSDKFYRGGNDWSLVEQLDFIKARCQEVLYQIE